MSVIETNGAAGAAAEQAQTNARMLAEMARRQRVEALRAGGWKVDLSGGQSATVCDPDTMTERRARDIKLAMVRSTPDGEHIDNEAALAGVYVLVAAFLRSWTLELPLPTAADTSPLLDLPAKDVSLLTRTAIDLKAEVFEDFTATPEALQDTRSPFGELSA